MNVCFEIKQTCTLINSSVSFDKWYQITVNMNTTGVKFFEHGECWDRVIFIWKSTGHSQVMVHESRKEVGGEVKCNRGLATHNIADSSLLNTLVLL